jgi:mono/diheme cytochrome c family protein
MSEEDLEAVIDYVILMSQRGELEEYMTIIATDEYEAEDEIPAEDFEEGLLSIRESWQVAEEQVVLPVTARPQYTAESVELGRQAFMTQGCAKCHGENGKGQTEWLSAKFLKEQEAAPAEQKIEINYDAWGHPAPAADLTARMLHGGRRPVDIYRRIYTGINGTPMPAFDQAFTEKPETLWHLVHFILSVVEGSEVQALESAPAGEEVASATGR